MASLHLCALFQLTGVLDDCFCDVESIDVFNNFKIYPRMKKLTERDYFRYYKVSVAASHSHGLSGEDAGQKRVPSETEFESLRLNLYCVV